MSIRILVTGGTIDKSYDAIQGRLTFTESHLPKMLEQVRCRLPLEIEAVLLLDSLEMGAADRENILERCREAAENRIIVTHGTDTMCETAAVIGQGGLKKTVVLVGAMVPFSFGISDALFNLGTAVAAVQLLKPGVYVTMNGRIFPWSNVRKNTAIGEFQTLDGGECRMRGSETRTEGSAEA